MTESFAQKKI